ncbi:Rha family transcriptional regulator [Aeromonas sp. Prich7-2]|uniref:Rha family transcriptional regulator n=1 Tax=Aeromonas sp. Prich7-2 TaxID=2823361 RepID=UPI001B340DEE|nr:Rha family transcriptional regulator [Aeromonas sp. Prich7-2]MBP4059022.1 Rha family transcriptional regulator [Aeromonas sp. Prich7-2]
MNNLTAFSATDLISLHHGQPMTTSLKVAEVFGKQHKNVLRKLETLECSQEFNRLNFEPVEYIDNKGEPRRAWNMTKNGFIFLVMGFTGKLAAQFKEHYIQAFDAMAAQLTAAQPAHGLTHTELRDLAWCWRAGDKMWHFAKEVEALLDAVDHRESANCYSIVREYRRTLDKARTVLVAHTADLPLTEQQEDNWRRVLPPLHAQPAHRLARR